jgi:hypothetical protein
MVDTDNFHSRRPDGDLSPHFQYKAAFEFAPESHGMLGAELSEVVVGVEVAEAQALVFGQGAHVGMEPPGDVRRPASETLDEITEFTHVSFKLCGRSAANFLVEFGRGLEAFRPGNRNPERNPLDQNAGKFLGRAAYDFLAHKHAMPITQVTDHLMSRHLSPSSLAAGLNRLQAP